MEATPDDDDAVLRDEAEAENRNETPVETTVAQETEPQPSPV
jgi:hypothetical protein